MKNIFLYIFILISINANAQQFRSDYCLCETKGVEFVSNRFEKDLLFESNYTDGKLVLKIINNTTEPIYLFKSYFEDDISTSPYLYRYDSKINTLNISFLPLLPYLTTKYSDRVIIQNRLIYPYQTVYDFYKILPNNEYSFSVKLTNFNDEKVFIKDFDIYSLDKFGMTKKFRRKKIAKKGLSDIVVKVAYYKSIDIICNADSYFLNEFEFNKQAKSFKILQTSIKKN